MNVKMKAGVLFSGVKDSSLMAVIIEKLGYQVELVTVNFGIIPSWKAAAESAQNLGYTHKVYKADENILKAGVEMILTDGFPNNGLNHIHHEILKKTAKNYVVVADGTRRDDRVPRLNSKQIRSLEDTTNVEYLNLAGFGHKSIVNISENIFNIKREPTNISNNSDYEIEIRYFIDQLKGEETAFQIFPEHIQSRVIGWRENE